ncbi:MAG TPA: hypothetical protein VFA68_20895 [Terriglobales bacterium]|nr:hypothetical protein [Terriglobales bacterium]
MLFRTFPQLPDLLLLLLLGQGRIAANSFDLGTHILFDLPMLLYDLL